MLNSIINIDKAVENKKFYDCWYETGHIGFITIKITSFNKIDETFIDSRVADVINSVSSMRLMSFYLMELNVIINNTYTKFSRSSHESILSNFIKIIDDEKNTYEDGLFDTNLQRSFNEKRTIYGYQDTFFTRHYNLLSFDNYVKMPNCEYKVSLMYLMKNKDVSDFSIMIKEKAALYYKIEKPFDDFLNFNEQMIDTSSYIKLVSYFNKNIDIRFSINNLHRLSLNEIIDNIKTELSCFDFEQFEFIYFELSVVNLTKNQIDYRDNYRLIQSLILINSDTMEHFEAFVNIGGMNIDTADLVLCNNANAGVNFVPKIKNKYNLVFYVRKNIKNFSLAFPNGSLELI